MVRGHGAPVGHGQQREHRTALRPAHVDQLVVDNELKWPEHVHPNGRPEAVGSH
jgi:hypothetical protein